MQDLTQFPSSDGSSLLNPFNDIIFSDQTPLPGNPKIHQSEMARCVRLIEQKVSLTRRMDTQRNYGELVTISAPTAGFGKTHLINRISSEVLNRVSVIDLPMQPQIDWVDMLNHTIQQLEAKRSVCHSGILSKSDEIGAFFLAHLINAAINGKIVKKIDCPSPISIRKDDFFLAFGGGANSKIFKWLQVRVDIFASFADLPDHYFNGFSRADICFWSNYFLTYFKKDQQSLTNLINGLTNQEAKKRTIQLLKLSSILNPTLIIVDHLDSCHGSDLAGMEVATVVTSISENLPNSVLIFSVNEDIWKSVFEEKLPSALLDRMESGENLELEAINADEARDIVVERLAYHGIPKELGFQFSKKLSDLHDWEDTSIELYPRKIIKQALELWETDGEEFSPLPIAPSIPKSVQSKPLFDFHFIKPIEQSPEAAKEEETFLSSFINPVEDQPAVEPNADSTNQPLQFSDIPNRSITPFPSTSKINKELPSGRLDLEESPDKGEDCYHQPTTNSDPEKTQSPTAAPEVNLNSKASEGQKSQVKDQAVNSFHMQMMDVYFNQLEEHFLDRKDSLTIDLSILESLIRNVGRLHQPLDQTEFCITGGKSICVNWKLSNQSVYVGFESAQNLFFYSNMVQKITSLQNHAKNKIVCFTHDSEPLNSELLTINGYDREALRNTFDFIHLSSEELALVYAGAKFFKEMIGKDCAEGGLNCVLKRLNPLWQRICKVV